MLNRAISGERQNLGESLWGGLSNAVSGRAGGYGKVKGAADAFRRGTLEGAARSVMNDIHDMAGIGDAGSRAYGRDSYSTGGDSADTALTNRGKSDPRTQCTPADTFNGGIGTQSTRGYRQSKSRGKNGTKSRFDLKKILKNAMFNGLMGGLTDTAFYGMDKAVDAAAVGFLGNQRGSGTQRRIAENGAENSPLKYDLQFFAKKGDNKIKPNPSAQGPHSVYKVDPNTGNVTNYKTYKPNPHNPSGFDEVIGYDGIGRPHTNKVTKEALMPHMHDKNVPGKVRKPDSWEIPKSF